MSLHQARLDHPGSQFKSPNPSCRVPLAWKVPGIRMWTSLRGHCSASAEGQGGVHVLGGGQMLLGNLSQASARQAQQPPCSSSGPGEAPQAPLLCLEGVQTVPATVSVSSGPQVRLSLSQTLPSVLWRPAAAAAIPAAVPEHGSRGRSLAIVLETEHPYVTASLSRSERDHCESQASQSQGCLCFTACFPGFPPRSHSSGHPRFSHSSFPLLLEKWELKYPVFFSGTS